MVNENFSGEISCIKMTDLLTAVITSQRHCNLINHQVLSAKKIDSSKEQIKTNFQTYSFYPLALNDYKYSLYNESEADSYDYRTIRGITNIINLDEKGLKLLRIAVKSQALEQSLLLTAIRHNQLQIDEIQLISAKKNIGSFFITESEKSNYRSKLREMSSHIRQHFFSVYQRKEKTP